MRCKNNFAPDNCSIQHLHLRSEQRFALLLLHRLFHADRVGHQLQVAQNIWLFSLDVALNGRIGQQFGQVALGHHQVEQVGAVMVFCLYVLR